MDISFTAAAMIALLILFGCIAASTYGLFRTDVTVNSTGSSDLSKDWDSDWNITVLAVVDGYSGLAWREAWNTTVEQIAAGNLTWQNAWNATVEQIMENSSLTWKSLWDTTVNALINAYNITWNNSWNTTVTEIVNSGSINWHGAWNATVQDIVLSHAFSSLNATNLFGTNYYLGNSQLGFVSPASFIIDVSGLTYRAWHGANSTLFTSSTNASAVINNAIGNLTSGRTWTEAIQLKGKYSISGIITVPSYTYIDLDEALLTEVTPHYPFFWIDGAHDIIIKGGFLNGQKEINGPPLSTTSSSTNESSIYVGNSVACYNLNFLNIVINGSINYGIGILTNSYNVLVQGCTFNYSYNDGVNLGAGCHDSRIIGNQFYYQGHVPIVLTTAYRNTIANNICLYSGRRTTFSSIHCFVQSYFNTIVGNVVGYGNGSGAHGIFIEGYQNTVANNIATNLGSAYGIYLYDGNNNTVTGNVINGTTSKGIGLSKGTIGVAGNIISENTISYAQDGIFFAPAGSSTQNTVQNNHISACSRYGIYVLGTTNTYVLNNDISNNTSTGIRLEPANFTYITGNTIFGNGGWGIHIVAATSGNNYIKNNVITNNTSGAISNVGTASVIQYNVGFVTENSVSGANTTLTTAVINHGLAAAATYVWCSFNTTAITGYTWTSTATQITITVTGTLPAAWTCYAKVEYVP